MSTKLNLDQRNFSPNSFATLVLCTALFSFAANAYENYEITEDKINQEIDQELQALSTPASSRQSTNMSQNSNQIKKTTQVVRTQTQSVATGNAAPVVQSSNTSTSTKTQITQAPAKKAVSTQSSKKSMKAALSGGAVVEAGSARGVQRLPITFVEASPLAESRAEELRRKRQDEEMRTEAKIVEKLEKSRMEDERKRAEMLLSNSLDQPQQVVVEAPAPVIIQQAAPVEQELTLESDTTMQSSTTMEETTSNRFFDKSYIGISAGVPAYPDFQEEIVGNYNVGLKFGMGHERFMFEVGLGMAQFLLENSPYTGSNGLVASNSFAVGLAGNGGPLGSPADFEMKQYMGSVGSRYQLLDGFIRPNVGGELIYSYRQYNSLEQTLETNSLGQPTYLASGSDYGTSHAVDFGLLAGVDLMVSPQFAIGADLKYLFNIGYRLDGSRGTAGTTVEKLQHLVGGLSARFQF